VTSPAFDLTAYNNPYISYYRWFANTGGGSAPNDSFKVFLSNGTTTSLVDLQTATPQSLLHKWNYHQLRVRDYFTPASNMQISFYTADAQPGHIVEGGLDYFEIWDSAGISSPLLVNNISFALMQNPVSDVLGFNYKLPSDVAAQILVTNILGETVLQIPIQHSSGSIQTPFKLPSGIYFARLKTADGESECLRFVKQ